MSIKIEELRGKGIICFEKNGRLWMNIDSEETLSFFLEWNGWGSHDDFSMDTDTAIADIMHQTVTYNMNRSLICFAKDQEWWNFLDIDRIHAVFNDRIWGWSSSSAFLAYMGELEFCAKVIKEMEKVSGQEVSDALSSKFTQDIWNPASDTKDFLEGVVEFLTTEFEITIPKSNEIEYY